ncbi:MAG: PAS domain S-box protein [Haloferacaceae archaeon]
MSRKSDIIRVLHVDDDPECTDLTAASLERERERFTVETATSVAGGLDRLAETAFDCIVSDYDMPGRNGIDFFRAVREETPDIPFILFTGEGSEEIASEAVSAGVTDYLQKGTGTDQYTVLANRIRNAVERYRAEEQLTRQSDRLNAFSLAFPDFAAIIDEEGRYVDLLSGPENKDLLYADPADLIGQKLTTVLDADPGERFLAEVKETIRADEGRRVEYELDVPAGRRQFEARLSPLPKRIEGKRAVVVVARDISDRVEQTTELRRTRELLAEMERIADIGAWEYDIDTEEVTNTAGVRRIYGIEPDAELTLQDALEFYHREDRERLRERFRACVDSGDPYELDVRLTAADGEEKWVTARGERTQASDERPVVRGYVQDVTAEKTRLARLEQAETLFENAQDMLFIIERAGEDFVVKRVNSAFERATGLSNEQLRGETPQELFGAERGQQIEQRYRQCLAAGEPISYEEVVEAEKLPDAESPDGEITHWETRIAPVRGDESSEWIVGATRDINEQKRRERELERRNDRLEEFASVVSHDLRNPLNVAQGRLELAQSECDSEHLDDVADALDRSQTLIDELLTLARGSDTDVNVEPVSLQVLAENCWQTVPADDATLDVETGETILANRDSLRQLLENLFRNAVEHGRGDATVTVGRQRDGFYVADDGTGVPDGQRERIFEAGYSTSEQGTGFGLRIVKQVADAHGWTIQVADSDGGGARFEVVGVDTPE